MAITYTNARNPQWGNASQTYIDLEVNFDHLPEEYVPFTANPLDTMAHGVEIYNRAVAGDFGAVAAYTPPADITGEDAMAMLRAERDALLTASDWMVLPDRTPTDAQLAYRQALRDLPSDYPNAYKTWDEASFNYVWADVTWPTMGGV